MKKIIRIARYITIGCIILSGLLYLFMALYYRNNFICKTFINGVYCTGKSIQEINDELNDNFSYPGLTVTTGESVFLIRPDDIDYTFDFLEPLETYQKSQNPFLWIVDLFCEKKMVSLTPKGTYDENAVEKIIEDQYAKIADKPKEVSLSYRKSYGYQLQNTKENIPDMTKIKEEIADALINGKDQIALSEKCYYTPSYTQKDKTILNLYDKTESLNQKEITYLFGNETVTLTGDKISKAVLTDESGLPALDEQGNLLFDPDLLLLVLQDFLDDYNTYRNHHFVTHDGTSVDISTGDYGNQIDMEEEVSWLLDFLKTDKEQDKREPVYKKEALYQEKNDIGLTYIEVDLTQQKLFYYEEGELILSTDVVTGDTKKNRATPQMVCSVYGKQKNRTLKGPGYESFVHFWMPVKDGIGIHDSSWRSKYGEDIYQTNGSHGCINTPYDQMELLYERVEIGTPVVLYYREETAS